MAVNNDTSLGSLNPKQLENEFKSARQLILTKSSEKRMQGLTKVMGNDRYLTEGRCVEPIIEMIRAIAMPEIPIASLKKMVPVVQAALSIVSDSISKESDTIFQLFLSAISSDFSWMFNFLTSPVREISSFMMPLTLYLCQSNQFPGCNLSLFRAISRGIVLEWNTMRSPDVAVEIMAASWKRIHMAVIRIDFFLNSISMNEDCALVCKCIQDESLVQVLQQVLNRGTNIDFDKEEELPFPRGEFGTMNVCVASLYLSIFQNFGVGTEASVQAAMGLQFEQCKSKMEGYVEKYLAAKKQSSSQPVKSSSKGSTKTLTKDASNAALTESSTNLNLFKDLEIQIRATTCHAIILLKLARIVDVMEVKTRFSSLSYDLLSFWVNNVADSQTSQMLSDVMCSIPYNALIALLLEVGESSLMKPGLLTLAPLIIRSSFTMDRQPSYFASHQAAERCMLSYFSSSGFGISGDYMQCVAAMNLALKAHLDGLKLSLGERNTQALEKDWDSATRLIRIFHIHWSSLNDLPDSIKTIELCDILANFLQFCLLNEAGELLTGMQKDICPLEVICRCWLCLSSLLKDKANLVETLLTVTPQRLDILGITAMSFSNKKQSEEIHLRNIFVETLWTDINSLEMRQSNPDESKEPDPGKQSSHSRSVSTFVRSTLSFVYSLVSSLVALPVTSFPEALNVEKIQYSTNVCSSSRISPKMSILTRIVTSVGQNLVHTLRDNVDPNHYSEKWYKSSPQSLKDETAACLALKTLECIAVYELLIPVLLQTSNDHIRRNFTDVKEELWSISDLASHCISVEEGKFNYCYPEDFNQVTSAVAWITSSLVSMIMSSKSSARLILCAAKAIAMLCLDSANALETQHYLRDLISCYILTDGALPAMIGHLHEIPDFLQLESFVLCLIGRGGKRQEYWASAVQIQECKEAAAASQVTTNKKGSSDKKPAEVAAQSSFPCLSPDHNGGPNRREWSLLLNVRADDEIRQHKQVTALHQAAIFGLTNLVVSLVNAGANADIGDSVGRSPLFYSIILNNVEASEVLLNQHPNINRCDNLGNSLLKYCFLSYHIENIGHWSSNMRNLAAIGADFLESDCNGDYPLHWALLGTDLEILIDKVQRKYVFDPISVSDSGNLCNIVTLLVECGSSLDNVNKHFEMTPLHAAIITGNADIANYFLDNGANSCIIDRCNRTPLHLTAAVSSREFGRLFARILAMSKGKHHAKGSFADNRKGKSIFERERESINSQVARSMQKIIMPSCIALKRLSEKEILECSSVGIDLLLLATGGLYVFGPGAGNDCANCYSMLTWRSVDYNRQFGPSDKTIFEKDNTSERQEIVSHISSFRHSGKSNLTAHWSSGTNTAHLLSRRGDFVSLRSIEANPTYFMVLTDLNLGQQAGKLICPLHAAILSGSCEAISVLLKEKLVSVDIRDYQSPGLMSFIHFALMIGCSDEILSLLVEWTLRHKKAQSILSTCETGAIYEMSGTPFQIAIRSGRRQLISWLASSPKVDVNSRMNYKREDDANYLASPLHVMFHQIKSSVERTGSLVSAFKCCADRLDLMVPDSRGSSVIEDAISSSDATMLYELITLKPRDVAAKVVEVTDEKPVSILDILEQQSCECAAEIAELNEFIENLSLADAKVSTIQQDEEMDEDDASDEDGEESKAPPKTIIDNSKIVEQKKLMLLSVKGRQEEVNAILLPITNLTRKVCPPQSSRLRVTFE